MVALLPFPSSLETYQGLACVYILNQKHNLIFLQYPLACQGSLSLCTKLFHRGNFILYLKIPFSQHLNTETSNYGCRPAGLFGCTWFNFTHFLTNLHPEARNNRRVDKSARSIDCSVNNCSFPVSGDSIYIRSFV